MANTSQNTRAAGTGHGTHTVVSRRPDVLRNGYLFCRRLPPVLALVASWTQLHTRHFPSAYEVIALSFSLRSVLLAAMLSGIWTLCFPGSMLDRRSTSRLRFLKSQSLGVVRGSVAATLLLGGLRFVVPRIGFWKISLTVFFLECLVAGLGCAVLFAALYEGAYRLSTPRLYVIIGSRRRAVNVYKKLKANVERRSEVLGFLDPDPDHAKYLPCDYLGSTDRLEQLLMRTPVDMVCLALPVRSHYAAIQEVVSVCERIGVAHAQGAEFFHHPGSYDAHTDLDHKLGADRNAYSLSGRLLIKRVIDFTFAAVLLALVSPLMLVIAGLIKLDNPGPVFFFQWRYGKNRRSFRMLKFRSMVVNAEEILKDLEHQNEASGALFKMKRDPRVTRVGRVLRMLSLDELPQLVNVLKGEMSLVGPRPMSLRDVDLISEAHLMRRFSVTPGMTGLWQVSGRSNTDFATLVKLDLHYIDRWSLAMDLRILLRTVPAVLRSHGAA